MLVDTLSLDFRHVSGGWDVAASLSELLAVLCAKNVDLAVYADLQVPGRLLQLAATLLAFHDDAVGFFFFCFLCLKRPVASLGMKERER